jgi:hypothetical protein
MPELGFTGTGFTVPARDSLKPQDFSESLAQIQARIYILNEFLRDNSWESLPLAQAWMSQPYSLSLEQYQTFAEELKQQCRQIYAAKRIARTTKIKADPN